MYIQDSRNPSAQLLRDVMAKVNALGHQPRVLIELDKMAYVPGLKSKFETVDWITSTSYTITEVQETGVNDTSNTDLGDEPTAYDPSDAGESGERFQYIKCAVKSACNQWFLDTHAYYFLLAVVKHETGFGTLGQGRPQNGSFIFGYGCPKACDPTYSSIKTQAYYAAKRYSEAMKSRRAAINANGGLTASDIDYFHEGGDKGYGKWIWSDDGPNWKNLVKNYYDVIKQGGSKWECNNTLIQLSSNQVAGVAPSITTSYATTNALNSMTFPIEGRELGINCKVSSHHYTRNSSRPNHRGIDLVGNSSGQINGAKVVASFAGKVIVARTYDTLGEAVMIQHTNGYTTVYGHLIKGSIQVSQGQWVEAGTYLGKVGNTGRSTGPHLHFEIIRGSQYPGSKKTDTVDPYPYLTKSATLMAATKSGSISDGNGDIGGQTALTVENIVFEKCFKDDPTISKNWTELKKASVFDSYDPVTKMNVRALGYKRGALAKDDATSFLFSHNFSADGYYKYTYYCNLSAGDLVRISINGFTVATYDKTNNGVHDGEPLYLQFNTVTNAVGSNSHIMDIMLYNSSGNAEFGLTCMKAVEVEVVGGTGHIETTIKGRKVEQLLETGATVYETTFYLEEDIIDWEVNSHYDMDSSTARFTLDNAKRIYSPSYTNSIDFPRNRLKSELSYFENGIQRHVLSEGTPVRIYAGYGDNMVRVFTGTIRGEIEEDAETNTVVVSCVDKFNELEEFVFPKYMGYPDSNSVQFDEEVNTSQSVWVVSSIIQHIVNAANLVGWRVTEEDWRYPDIMIEDTYYIDIDRGGQLATVWNASTQQFEERKISTIAVQGGYRNPYVTSVEFPPGTRASDAINQLIRDTSYRAFCDRYGTFHLRRLANLWDTPKWEFKDSENLYGLTTSVDHQRIRNHLMIVGSSYRTDHFLDQDLIIELKGKLRTAQVQLDWVDESHGANARGMKEEVAKKLFFDMKRQARTFKAVVKGNPSIDVLDGCYVYSEDTSTNGYYLVKGNRLYGNQEGMINELELTWEMDDHSAQL